MMTKDQAAPNTGFEDTPDTSRTVAPVTQLVDTLKSLVFLPPESIQAVVDAASIETLEPNETIFEEGDEDNALIIVLAGEVTVTRRALHTELPLGPVHAGGLLGQLSFLDSSTRQVTAKVGKEPAIIARISPINVILADDGDRHYDMLRAGLVVPVVRSSRQQSKELVIAIEERQRFAEFFLFMVAIIYGCVLIYFLVVEQYVTDTTSQLFAWQNAAILALPSLFVVYRLKLGRADLGLRREDFARSLMAGLMWGAGVSALFVGTFWSVRALGLMPGFEPVQTLNSIDLALYFPHTFIQEFVARGIIQNGYQRFFDDEKGYRSVVFSSFVFAIAHIPVGLLAVGLTFFGGLLFGLFFLRYRHLIGVTLVHFAVGGSAIGLGLI